MAFFLPALAAVFASKVANSGQPKPQQQLNFTFQHQQRMPWMVQPYQPMQQPVSPIVSAYADQPKPAQPNQTPSSPQSGWDKTKDQFLAQLSQGLVQRLLFGNGQQNFTYSPPSFR